MAPAAKKGGRVSSKRRPTKRETQRKPSGSEKLPGKDLELNVTEVLEFHPIASLSRSSKEDIEQFRALATSLSLCELKCANIRTVSSLTIGSPPADDLRYKVTTRVSYSSKSQDHLLVMTELHYEIHHEQTELLAIDVGYLGVYRVGGELKSLSEVSDSAVRAFAYINAGAHGWTYAREHLQSIASRFGFLVPPLPLRKIESGVRAPAQSKE